jgi:hypothetical protein
MKKSLAIIFLVMLSAAAASAQYVGYEYKGVTPETVLPNGVKHLGGGLISDVDADPTYGISQVSKGKTEMLWLEVSTGQNETGITGWRVLDVVSFPALMRTQHIHMHHDPAVECSRGGKIVEDLVAVGTINRSRGAYTPQRAWIADIAKKKFVPTATAGLRCIYSEP